MHTKKMLVAFALLLSATTTNAQQEKGTWSIIPRVGVNLSKLTNDPIYIEASSEDMSVSGKHKAGMRVGVDVEYQAGRQLAVSLGVFYSMQGTRYPDFETGGTPESSDPSTLAYTGFSDYKENLQYIAVPLMLHGYVAKGLAINVGIQPAFCVKANYQYAIQDYTVAANGERTYETATYTDGDLKNVTRAFDFATPIGLSYEYENVIIDARYVHGWTNMNKIDGFDIKNSTFEFSVAYRFAL